MRTHLIFVENLVILEDFSKYISKCGGGGGGKSKLKFPLGNCDRGGPHQKKVYMCLPPEAWRPRQSRNCFKSAFRVRLSYFGQ